MVALRRERVDEWSSKPGREGWHWLERLQDKTLVIAYWRPHRLNWWVADEEGRTRPMSDQRVRMLYAYRGFVEPPRS